MKYNHCLTDFKTKFESKAIFGTAQPKQQAPQTVYQTAVNPQNKKKPFFLRWWFILIVILVGFVALVSGGDTEKVVWNDMILGHMLPEPVGNKGKIWSNSSEKLHVDINKITNVQYESYVQACKENGFTIDGVKDSYSYKAHNSDGYKLYVSYSKHSTEMNVELDIPMEMTEIKWPSSVAGKQLPQPESNKGKFLYEYDDSFYVYIGDTSEKAYNEYVSSCADEGFNVDYNKRENYYHAENAEGWSIHLKYEGFNIMSIDIDAPDDFEEDATTTETTTLEVTTTKKSANLGSDVEIILKTNHPKYLDNIEIANAVWENEIKEKKVFVTDSIYSNSTEECIIKVRTSEEDDNNGNEVEYISAIDIYFNKFDETISLEEALNIVATYLPEEKIQEYYAEEMSFSELTDFENQTKYAKSYELKEDSYSDISQLDYSFGVMVWTDENGNATEARIAYTAFSKFDDETMSEWTYDYFTTTNEEPITTTEEITTTETTTRETTTRETTTKSGITVYITPYGEKYHYSASCAGGNARARDYDDVKNAYDPCKKCAY